MIKFARSRIIRKSGRRDYCVEEVSELKRKWDKAIANNDILEYRLAPGYEKGEVGRCAIFHDHIKKIEQWYESENHEKKERTD